MSTGNQNSFVPTFQNFQVNDELLRQVLDQSYVNMAYAINYRDIGTYDTVEVVNGQQFFGSTQQRKRFAFRKVFSIGSIATGATSNTAHGITGQTLFTRIYGTCITDVVDYRPLPYPTPAALNQQISLTVTSTNIVIVNGAGSPNITSAIVVLEYLKN
jgi:hypothetical protein